MRWFLLFVLLLSLVACTTTTKQEYYVCPDGAKVLDYNDCPKPQTPTTPTPQTNKTLPAVRVEENVPVLTPELKTLVDKSNNVKIVQFNFRNSANPFQEYTYFASRTRLKVVLDTRVLYQPNQYYDTVYLDFAGHTADGFCENKGDLCLDPNKDIVVKYDQYSVPTPFTWLSRIEKGSFTGRTNLMQGRTGKEIGFTFNGTDGTMFIDSYFGIPLQIKYGGNTYDYSNVVINEARETDLYHQDIKKS